MQKIVERLYDGLASNTLQTVGALIIFLLALPLIRSGLREKPPPAPPPAPPVPIEIESAWLIQNLTRMQMDIDAIKERLGVMSNQISGVAQLLKRRQGRKPKD
ncbi:MAG: hypothetical protein Q8L13_11835 [Bradyrhizobium sp.]|uniref:hypothetical protein n=1 Tax=Bradyrhizobium sp. TaxID=376 RepID=UPI0027311526|nr:hypothetical protein [Bradyrhizobium sp.]MDP1867016.1 hypothetical protein [Bradyrhizobium sp.]